MRTPWHKVPLKSKMSPAHLLTNLPASPSVGHSQSARHPTVPTVTPPPVTPAIRMDALQCVLVTDALHLRLNNYIQQTHHTACPFQAHNVHGVQQGNYCGEANALDALVQTY